MTAHDTRNATYILVAVIVCSALAALIKGSQLLHRRCASSEVVCRCIFCSTEDTATLADGSSPSDVAVELERADTERVFDTHRREWSPMRSLQDLAAL